MFESLALENPRNSRRNWMTVVSFALQTTGLAMLVLAPIRYTEAVAPKFDERIVAPVGMIGNSQPRPAHERSAVSAVPIREGGVVYVEAGRRPHWNPPALADNNQPAFSNDFPVEGGTGLTQGSVIDKLLAGTHPAVAAGPPVNARRKPYPISHFDEGMLIKQVQPLYPIIAKQAGIQGKVLLAAVIDTQGRITHLRALSGHPFLVPAAVDAVQQWRYKPYILNGQAVEVETEITVNFTLHRD